MRCSNKTWMVIAAVVVGGIPLLHASTGSSQPSGTSAAIGGPVSQRVRELESRIARLELRLLTLERTVESEAKAAKVQPPASVKAFPRDELGYDACDPPFVHDSRGVKLLKAGCETHGGDDPCDPPFMVDAEGIKTLRSGCEQVSAAPCDLPYTLDGQGTRIVRRECLDVGY